MVHAAALLFSAGLVFLHAPSRPSATVTRPRAACRRGCASAHCSGAGGPEADGVSSVERGFFKQPRPASGVAAFDDSHWSVYVQVAEGGGTMFTVEFLEDRRCRFSDKQEIGNWECAKEKLVFDKPKGLFQDTLIFSAKLKPPSREDPRARLVDGVVKRFVKANTTANQGAKEDGLVILGSFNGYMLDRSEVV